MDEKVKAQLLKHMDDIIVEARKRLLQNQFTLRNLSEDNRVLKRKVTELYKIRKDILDTEVKKIATRKAKK